MGRIRDFEAEAAEAVFGHLPGRHHHTSAAPAAAAVTTTGGHMSLATTLHAIATELETVGEDVLADAKAVAANPITAPVLKQLAGLAGFNIDPAVLTKGLGIIEALHIAYTPVQPTTQAAPQQ